jgi:hypothetical protein
LHPLLGEKLVELGKRDRIPAEERGEKEEGEKPERISRFFLVEEIINVNFDVPKVKCPGIAKAKKGNSSLKL